MKLKDICEINPKPQGIVDNTEVSFVPMSSVSEDGKIDISDIRSYQDVKKGYTVFRENDVLFAKITPCMENGKGAIARGLMNGIGCGSSEYHVLRANNKLALPEWIYYLTAWEQFRREAEKHMTGSAGQRRVPKAYLENYDVNVPSLSVQTQQTEVLLQLRQLIDNRKKELQKLDELIKARFVELFKDSTTITVDEICDSFKIGPFGSALHKSEISDNGYAFVLGTDNAVKNEFAYKEIRYINEKKYEELEKYKVEPGEVIMSMMGTVGRVAVVPEDIGTAIISSHLCILRVNESLMYPEFFHLAFCKDDAIQHQIDGIQNGSIMKGFNLKIVKAFRMKCPPLEEQKRFVDFVKQLDKSKVVVQQAIDKAQLLFDSFMQQYFG